MLIYIVEDDKMFSKTIHYNLSRNPDNELKQFYSGKELLDNLHGKPDVITLDYRLPDVEGDVLLKQIKAELPETTVVVISGQEDVKTAVDLLKVGVFDYIVKNQDANERIWKTVQNIGERQDLKEEITELRKEVSTKYEFKSAIQGESPGIKKVFALMEKAAKSSITVSITGETGTGKELVAKSIHYNSDRKNKPFVAINVSAIPADLIESELFGHEKGAFTGAVSRRIGKFEQANGGTLFLDEIAEMDLNLQAKLLRVLQERELVRVGGNSAVKFDARVLVATHRNLMEEVKAGKFRQDLFYRLLGLPVALPALRERGKDIILLAKQFISSFAKENKLGKLSLSSEASQKLLKYSWPGNVRELKAVVELAAVLSQDEVIPAENISFQSNETENELLLEERSMDDYINFIIRHFLNKYDENVLLVADKLDIGKSTIYRKLKEGI